MPFLKSLHDRFEYYVCEYVGVISAASLIEHGISRNSLLRSRPVSYGAAWGKVLLRSLLSSSCSAESSILGNENQGWRNVLPWHFDA